MHAAAVFHFAFSCFCGIPDALMWSDVATGRHGQPGSLAGEARALMSYLLILQAQQYDLLHQGQLRLLAPLGALADVAGVKGDLVAILAALVARLRAAVANGLCRIGPTGAVTPFAIICCSASASSSATSRQS